ncbi:MAG TPA: YhbY family RNA-binding protein [Casimicrobiaceae bacterium]|nr:YhbY family RNA-binding protein [Casimicrobiaceae bacterium]
MDPLTPSFRRELRARAHALDPVVAIGHHGLTAAVLHEIDVALKAHELVKVRAFNDDREERGALLARIVEALDCAPVQTIGKLFVLWRARPLTEQPEPERKARAETAPPNARERTRDARRAPVGVPRAASRRRRRTVR